MKYYLLCVKEAGNNSIIGQRINFSVFGPNLTVLNCVF
jgi:hypothetical protein